MGIRGDQLNCKTFIDCLKGFTSDPHTKGIITIGEIGGTEKEESKEWLAKFCDPTKPVIGFISITTAPILGGVWVTPVP